MASAYSQIETLDELRSHSAVMGMVLFGLKYQRPIPDRDRQLELAVRICDTVAEGTQLRHATRVESFDDLAQLNAFSSIERRQRGNPQKLSEMAGEALAVKDTLAKIRDSMAVPDDELHRAASFFKSLYRVT
jgi:hypothetical protein